MEFRIKYLLWRIEANSAEEGKKKVISLMKSGTFFKLEDASVFDDRRPLWRRLLFG